MVYDAEALEPLQQTHYRFRQPSNKLAALRAVFGIVKLQRADGWLRADEGRAYRGLAARTAAASDARGVIVEVGCWFRAQHVVRGRAVSRPRAAVSSASMPGPARAIASMPSIAELLAHRDIEAEFRGHLDALGLAADIRRTTSLAAAAPFGPGSVDLVFSTPRTMKLRSRPISPRGGRRCARAEDLAGHDYRDDQPGVIAAVDHAVVQLGLTLACGPGSLWRFARS